jgi:hypothetical protein
MERHKNGLSQTLTFVKTLNIYPNYQGFAMLSTLLMLAWILAICWLRSDVQTPDSNPASLPVQDTIPNPEIKQQEPAVREFHLAEAFQSSPDSYIALTDVAEAMPKVAVVEEVTSLSIYEKDWKSGCCLISNKNGKKLTGVTLERRIAKLIKLNVLI